MKEENINEEWLWIPGFEGIYEISNLGTIKSMPRLDRLGRKIAGKIMTSSDSKGYRNVTLSGGALKGTFFVHRLVALAFMGPRPNGMCVNHKNGIKSDSRLENLEYVTYSRNAEHSFEIGLQCNKGEQHPGHKLNDAMVVAILEDLKTGCLQQKEIAKKHGTWASTVSSIHRGLAWPHVPRN